MDPITALLALVALLAAVGAPLIWARLVLDRQANALDDASAAILADCTKSTRIRK